MKEALHRAALAVSGPITGPEENTPLPHAALVAIPPKAARYAHCEFCRS